MNRFKLLLPTLALALALPFGAWAQTAMTSTTLAEAVDSTETTIDITSATGVAVGDIAFVDYEAMLVISVDSTLNRITVQRGYEGTLGDDHTSGQTIYLEPPDRFINKDLHGACTAGSEYPNYTPLINVSNGNKFRCTNSQWDLEQTVTRVFGSLGNNLMLQTVSDNKPVTINSRNYTQTSGSSIGFQSKPAQTVTSTGSVIGAEISPRVNNDIDIANVIGLHVDTYLKGTTANTVSADVRGMQIEMVTDDSGTHTVSGNVTGLRFRTAFSATAITGDMEAIRIEFPEAQTNSQTYDQVLTLTGTVAGVWNNAPGTEPSTADGYIKVKVNGAVRYIQLYSTAPTD